MPNHDFILVFVIFVTFILFQIGGTWQPTADGRRLIGRMVLKKLGSNQRDLRSVHHDQGSEASLLGLKVTVKISTLLKCDGNRTVLFSGQLQIP